VTYVQNITDVGHLTDDADEGEDKVEKAARARRVHPMQIAEDYTRRYFEDMDRLNVRRPDISPRASGHVIEQIEHVKRLLASGHAYEAGGNVYFDVASWDGYGRLSGRSVEEMQAGARVETRGEKRHPADFALWKAAEPGHIMQWPSPWGMGYPGWHIECTVMAQKYLGGAVDIHGGGIENQFPHHENEIAQAEAATGKRFVKYWLHNNMVTVDGQKMGKSLGNFITLRDAFERWDPMVLRLFLLQTHYRSQTDFSEEALEAAKAGYERLSRTFESVHTALEAAPEGEVDPKWGDLFEDLKPRFFEAMDDDFNTPSALGVLFDYARETNRLLDEGNATCRTLQLFWSAFMDLGGFILGLDLGGYETGMKGVLEYASPSVLAERFAGTVADLVPLEGSKQGKTQATDLIQLLIGLRNEARAAKDFETADRIRDRLAELGIVLEDTPDGTTWRFK
jgi:cysteinyl-tRNA synthetase